MARTKRNATTERVYLFFKTYVRQHHRAPSIRDISNGISEDHENRVSTSVIDYHLNKLVAQGRLCRGEQRSARAYYLPDKTTPASPPLRTERGSGGEVSVMGSGGEVSGTAPGGEVDPLLVLPDRLLPARLYLDLLRSLPDRLSATIVFDQAITSLPDTHRAVYRFLSGHKHPRRRAHIAQHLGLMGGQVAPAMRELGALRLIEGSAAHVDGDTVILYHAVSFADFLTQERSS